MIDQEKLNEAVASASERGLVLMQLCMMEAIRLELRAIRAQRVSGLAAPTAEEADTLARWALGQD